VQPESVRPQIAASSKYDSPSADNPDRRTSRLEVIFATKGRANILVEVFDRLRHQSRKPDSIIISCPALDDAGELARRGDVKLVLGPAGLPHQRNAALRQLDTETAIVVFFDDDFVAHRDWLANVEQAFEEDPEIVAITGRVLADGVKGAGISIDQADQILQSWDGQSADLIRTDYSPYGCNMAFRRSAIRDVLFDERLVLYGWLEDHDFGGALRKRGGRSIKLGSACGVHLGAKAARVTDRKYGYSQVVNPIYLYRKGTMTLGAAADHVFRNLASNLVLSLRPEAHIDRAGRLRGNIIGLKEVLLGRATPERAALL
jgi:hypothetical protein